jgi:hypothetical protein
VHPEFGALAEPGDAADLAAKVEKVVTEKNGGVPACREYVEQNFSWERTFTRLLSIYGEVIAVRNGRAGAGKNGRANASRLSDRVDPMPRPMRPACRWSDDLSGQPGRLTRLQRGPLNET